MPDNDNEEFCDNCGHVHEPPTPLDVFKNCVSEVFFGARLITETARLKTATGVIEVPVVGVADDFGNASFFALAFNEALTEVLDLPEEHICAGCVDEQAEEILRNVDLDVIPFINPPDHPKEQ